MASFRGTRFPGPMFNQNFNVNPAGDRHPRPPFQRPPSVPYRPFQTPERFVQGNLQNRPQFSNFPNPVGASGFRNRVPSPSQVLRMNSPPSQVFRMNTPPPNQAFGMNTHPAPNQAFGMNTHPAANQAFGMNTHSAPNQVFNMNTPPPPSPNQAFGMNTPPPPSPNQVFGMNSPSPNQGFRMNPPSNQAFRMNLPCNQPFRMNLPVDQPFRMNAPADQSFRMNSPADQPFRMNSPADQPFRMNSSPPVPRQRFGGHFERPFRPWNQMPSFGGSKSPFQSRPRMPVQSHQHKDLPLQVNKKRKQKTREFKKLKEDTTEKPFSCDTCDRAFVTESELNDHLSQHAKCDYENCTFEAHPKILALHQKMQHDTGYADTINKLKDAAEIQKWREERKRRFPTAENIRKRKAEQAEREARGEVLETKEFGKFKRRREGDKDVENDDNRKRTWKRNLRRNNRRRNFQSQQYPRPVTVNIDSESDSDSDSHITLKEFSGLTSLINSAQKVFVQSADVRNALTPPNIVTDTANEVHLTPCKQNLSKLDSENASRVHLSHADNNTSSKEMDHTPLVLNNEKNQDSISPADESVCEISANGIDLVQPEVVTLQDSDDEGPVSLPITKSEKEPIVLYDSSDDEPVILPIMKSVEKVNPVDKQSLKTKAIQHSNRDEIKNETKLENNLKTDKSDKVYKKEHSSLNGFANKKSIASEPRKSTLLEKLLADDIRHERNVVLQCIRHIVNNKFFGIEKRCKKS